MIVLLGANPAETMPPIMRYFEAQQAAGGKLLVVDPRRTPTAEAASLHLQLLPGTDAALANGILHVAVREKLIDRDFIAARTTGFAAVEKTVASYWPDRVERITGVPAAIIEVARLLGKARSAMVLSARGAEQQSHGVDNVIAFTNLLLALGHAGKRHAGYGCLTGQGNGQGGREHGLKADQLPGYRKLSSEVDRAHAARAWGITPDELPAPGLPAVDLFDALGQRGGVRGLWVMGANPVVSAPNAAKLERQLGELDLLVVSDPFLSETARLADVVLPVTQWAEEEGTITNLEGRVLYRRAVCAPPDGVKSDLEVMKLVANALGRGPFVADSPAARSRSFGAPAPAARRTTQASATRASAGRRRVLAVPERDRGRTPRPFAERFATPDGRARFYAVQYRPPAEEPNDDYPFYLTTGRLMAHYQSGAQTRRVPALLAAEPEAFVEIHPSTGCEPGRDRRRARPGRDAPRSRLCKVRTTHAIRFDTLFMPFHFSGPGRANTLTNDAVDPVSKIPEFKMSAAGWSDPDG